MMTPRQRVLAALACQPSDTVPFDIGGTKTTSINVHAYRRLLAHLEMDAPVEFGNYRSQRTHMSESVSRRLGSDVRRVHVPYPSPLPPAVTARVQLDEWGAEWTQAADGPYFASAAPLATIESSAETRQHAWPAPEALLPVQALAEAAGRLRQETDCAICLDLPDGPVHTTQFLRGFEQWLVDSALDQPLFEYLMDAATDIYVAMVDPLLDRVGDAVDLVLICDDIGTQGGPLISPAAYRKLVKPRHRRIFDAIQAHSPARILFHSCGSMRWALPDLIDMGVAAFNPVQVSAKDMDPCDLKREFGGKLCFWGGIDTQHVLPFGAPDDVRQEVRRRIDELAEGGGYVIGSVHIIQPEVPPENIVAMAEAAREQRPGP
jgi:uroporphyrinogen decarboxylase